MNATGRCGGRASAARRLGLTAAVAAVATITTGIAAVAAVTAAAQPAGPRSPRPDTSSASSASSAAGSAALRHETAAKPVKRAVKHVAKLAVIAPTPLVLTASDRRDCPRAATACVDLTRHITWLQAGGKVSFGPVRMEPGKPGSAHATPRGAFNVSWKAGPGYMSNIYHEPMPWATFFATGGIAFHGGSLTRWSHGCVHLSVANAHLYQEKLPIGAEVAVF
jgi:lipoprotein-anchoring transpeptidase ErfK/SrfK